MSTIAILDTKNVLDRSRFNVIGPDMVAELTPYHKRIATQITLSANPVDGDVYALMGDAQKLAPSKLALLKIADAAGVRWQYSQCKKVPASICEFCKAGGDNCLKCSHHGTIAYQVVGAYQDAAGQWRSLVGTAEVDPSERSKTGRDGMTDGQRMKQYLLRHVESRAFNAAIRNLGVKQWYTPAELKKPFVVIRTYFDGYSDPDFKRLLMARAASDMAELYGNPDPHPELSAHAREVLKLAEGNPADVLQCIDTQTGEIIDAIAEAQAPNAGDAKSTDDLPWSDAEVTQLVETKPAADARSRSRGDLMNELQALAMDYYPSAPGIALNNHLKRECGGKTIGMLSMDELQAQIGVFKTRIAERNAEVTA
jgi:hypothetical protein